MKNIPIEKFGKDHWSLLAYVEYRAVNNGGHLDIKHLRCKNPAIATSPLGQNFWKPEYGTRLKGFFKATIEKEERKIDVIDTRQRLENHDDFDCLDDLEAAGLLKNVGTLINPYAELTSKGQRVAALLSKHKQAGGPYAYFVYNKKSKYL